MIVPRKFAQENVKSGSRGRTEVGVSQIERLGRIALPKHRKPHSKVTGKAAPKFGLHGVSRPEIGTA